MRKTSFLLALIALITWMSPAAGAACTATGYYRDGINLTAALIASGDLSDQSIDATGCNNRKLYKTRRGRSITCAAGIPICQDSLLWLRCETRAERVALWMTG
jgi:hypothetical protein